MKYLNILISLCSTLGFAYKQRCPDASQWSTRARVLCSNPAKYYCLFDENLKEFIENCNRIDYEQRGGKIVIFGDFTRGLCAKDKYQPFTYITNVSSGCIYKKSLCNEEGQVIYDETDPARDIRCACDYTRGYDFVTRPRNPCYCVPSEEDCSCYVNPCSKSRNSCNETRTITKENKCSSFKISAKDKIPVHGPVHVHKEQTADTLSKQDYSNMHAFWSVVSCVIGVILFCVISVCARVALDNVLNECLREAYVISYPPATIEYSGNEQRILMCKTSKSNCDVNWIKNPELNEVAMPKKSDGRIHTISIKDMSVTDEGCYVLYFNKKRIADTILTMKPVFFVTGIVSQACFEGDTIEFNCEVSDDNMPAEWYKDNKKINEYEDNIVPTAEGRTHRLPFEKCLLMDSGSYTIKVENATRNATLTVKAVFVSEIVSQTCIEGDTIEFSCDVSDDNMTTEWYKDKKKINDVKNIVPTAEGRTHRLRIEKCLLSDFGTYTIKVENAIRNATLTVKAFIKTHLVNAITLEGINVSLACKAEKCGLKPVWYKDGEEITQSDDIKINESEGVYSLTCLNVNRSMKGKYRIKIDGHSSEAYLDVKETPQVVLEMSEHERQNFIETANSGGVRRSLIRIMIVGEKSDWKTYLQRRLLDKEIDDETSTDCINIEVRKCKIDLETREWIFAGVIYAAGEISLIRVFLETIVYCCQERDDGKFPIQQNGKNECFFDCVCWNFVGQREYYVTHQTFLTSNTIYILAVDLSKDWKRNTAEDMVHCEFDDIGGYIEFWIDNIRCYVNDDNSTRHNAQINRRLQVLLVGTDKTKDEQICHFDNYLDGLPQLKEDLENRMYVPKTSPSDDKPEFTQIRSEIFKLAQHMPIWDKHIHWTWILLERQLLFLKEKVITYKKVKSFAISCCFPMQETTSKLDSFLRYEHEIGNIVYCKDFLILDPKWLVNMFKCIVAPGQNQRKHLNLTDLKQTGTITAELIFKLFENVQHVLYLKKIMEQFNILVPCDSVGYYIPSIVKVTTFDTVYKKLRVQSSKCKRTSWLCLDFKFLPPGFFSHVLVNYIPKYHPARESEREPALYRGIGIFNLDNQGCRKLALCVSSNTIAMQVWQWDPKDGECHSELRTHLLKIVAKVQKRYRCPIQYTVMLKCPDGRFNRPLGKIPINDVMTDSGYYCEEHKSRHEYKDISVHWIRIQVKKTDERFSQRCNTCKGDESSYWCTECTTSLCDNCNSGHQGKNETLHHHVLYKEDEYEFVPKIYNRKDVEIIDLKILGEDVVYIADSKDGQLVVVGEKEKTIKLPDKPWSIAVIDNFTLAATLPESRMVAIVEIRHGHIQEIDVEAHCYGIMYSNNYLFVGCFDSSDRTLKKLLISGEIERTIELNFEPKNICGSESKIYCIDRSKLYCIDTNGNFLFKFVDMDMIEPCSITNDDAGNVLILCRWSKNIYRVRSNHTNGEKHQIIIKQLPPINNLLGDKQSTQMSKIQCMCYNVLSQSIVIGIDDTIYDYKQITTSKTNDLSD